MTILYNAVMRVHESMAKRFVRDLLAAGIKENKQGKSIHDMDYYELRRLVDITVLIKE